MRSNKFLELSKIFLALLLLSGALLINILVINKFCTMLDSDLIQDLNAARNFLNGRSIYSVWNAHPPFDALLMLPFAGLSNYEAVFGFSLLSLIIFTLSLWCLAKSYNYKDSLALLMVSFFLLWFPTLGAMALGTFSSLVSALVIFAAIVYKRNSSFLPGVLVAFASLIKVYPVLLLVPLISSSKRRALFGFIFTIIVLSLVIIFTLGWNDTSYYMKKIPTVVFSKYSDFRGNISLFGISEVWFGSSDGLTKPLFDSYFFKIMSLVLSFTLVGYLYRRAFIKQAIVFEATCIVMLLFSPISWIHYFGVLVPAILYILFNYDSIVKVRIRVLFGFSIFSLSGIPVVINERLLSKENLLHIEAIELIGPLLTTVSVVSLLYCLVVVAEQNE